MKFRFRLERLKMYRKRIEDDAKKEYLLQQMEYREGEEEIRKMRVSITKTYEKLNERKIAGVGCSSLHVLDHYIEGARKKVEIKTVEQQEKALEVEEKKTLFLEVRKERMVLDKLEERQKARFEKEERKKEMKNMDEMVVMKQNRERVGTVA